ncbi:carbohydrate ABC transporter permease [Plantibacter flavus]|uniref:carbohydrate ABC transporter permease n=1 Tax=Plantibacter flavus TaxID=150123 RepID=UPI001F0B4F26|nr:carbohydrate ABC transporter permease [Plantibacter flavus]
MTASTQAIVQASRPSRRRQPHGRSSLWVGGIFAWVYAALLIIPIYYLLISSVKDNTEIFGDPFGIPQQWLFENYLGAWTSVDLGQALVNSVLITAVSLVLTLVLAIPAAYSIARSRGRIGVIVERVFAAGFLIPQFAALVPTVILSFWLSLYGTKEFLMLFFPATALPISVVLLTQFIRAIPYELEESAQMDGANRFSIILRLIIPMAAPGIVTVTILNFLAVWNEYLFSLLILAPAPENRTIQVALPLLTSQQSPQYGQLAAGIVITLLPVYLVYAVLYRRMQDALVDGALK